MQQKECIKSQAYEQCERVERRQESTSVVSLSVNRHAVHQVSDHNTPEETRKQAANKNYPIPGTAPAGTIVLAAKLKRRTTENKREKNQEHLRIETA